MNKNLANFSLLQQKYLCYYLDQLNHQTDEYLITKTLSDTTKINSNFMLQKEFYALLNKFMQIPLPFLDVFSEESYLLANPDIAEAIQEEKFLNALEHFILFGYDEVKNGTRRIGNPFPYMSENDYLRANPDLELTAQNTIAFSPFHHFLEYGMHQFLSGERLLEGEYVFEISSEILKNITKLFDEKNYLKANPDVYDAIKIGEFENGWDHFIRCGIHEARKGERKLHPRIPFLSECKYVSLNPDILAAMQRHEITMPYEHFLVYGYTEMTRGTRRLKGYSNYFYTEPELDEELSQVIGTISENLTFSIIMPVYNVEPKWLEMAIESVRSQWYPNWELCIVDDASTNKDTIEYLKSINDPKIKIELLTKNVNISEASNVALKMASGEYIVLMDHDDELTVDALYEVAKTINESGAEFIYSDEDKIEMNGTHSDVHYKPDYAPDMILSQNYISHLGVIKKELIDTVGGFSTEVEGSQDYDLYLKVLEQTNKIVHIPKVLYHWRKIPGSTAAEFSDKSYAQEAGKLALENTIKRRSLDATVENGKYPGTYRVKYAIKFDPLVSIIIPFKDKPELLKMCIDSILDKSTYENYEIIGISNNSTETSTFSMMKQLEKLDSRVHFYEYNKPFNYSEINNYAVHTYAKGEHIVLLNNDIEIITPEWIESMLEFSQRPDIGAVGAKLYYPNDTIQHAGVIVGLGGVAGHSHKHFPKEHPGYFFRLNISQNLLSVTAACLMVKRSAYDTVGGLNEVDLKIAFNDVDFCLRLVEAGYLNVFTPYCEAYHHESISRGAEDNPEKIKRFQQEIEYMKKNHQKILTQGDPYYNSNLTLDREDFSVDIKVRT
ncbi:glycosyltransferase family 2 protein [Sulfuricurvum sp.]|uniref:glycosyltransferase family 2 protein n=1 Tax=Sulfuricurvum sp. TaxID=2025608 RepID=UPI002626C0DD|nr:glycosyltransferase family 2 protein [Sulfuricurvum sp.]MDD4949462.1 glycosyltransferase family 2 protein [Sulfuricurvum sp.]